MKREQQIEKAALDYCGYDTETIYAHIENAFIAGAEWADAHPHWISVEDELPPKKSEYDALSNNVLATDGKEIYESVYNHDFGEWFTHDLWAINNITHWMPLPTQPTFSEIPNNLKGVER